MNTRKSNITILTILIISALIVATAAPAWAVKPEPPTSFLISGEVNYDTGEPVQNLTVTVENTDEVFAVEISNNSYQVSTDSSHVSAGDALHFNASNDNVTEFDHTVTQDEMNAGGFVQNITIIHPGALKPDLIVTDINAYHNNTGCTAWFNISNEIDITVKNDGDAAAGASNVSLYIEGDYGDTAMYYFGKLPVPGLGAGNSSTVTFTDWVPIGDDCLQEPCNYMDSYKDYNFTAVADCDGVVIEGNETNNATTMQDRTCYNGYIGDEPLENVAHGVLHGGVLFTTGDGSYGGLYSVDDSRSTNYNITIPEGASVEFAHLKVFYTWHYEKTSCPQMAVSITNATGTYDLPLEKAYNDLKCTCPGAAWVFPWGNYVYDLTDYIQDGGEFTVTVTRTGGPSFCVAAPGVDLVYEDENAPLIEYWINEGADVLLGGRRYPTSSNLAWWECMNNATFQASTETLKVVNATVGVATPWGDSVPDDILFFNDVEIGRGVYDGYGSPCSYTIDSLTMKIEGSNAQVGINVSNVTDLYLQGSDNVVTQADDGDNVMACNAILVVEYESVVQEPDLIVTDINAYHNNTGCTAWFNISNEIDITVKNDGDAAAGASNVSLYIEGDYGDTAMYYFGKLPVPDLGAGNSSTVTFTDWVPIGDDCLQEPCNYMDSYKDYNFTAVADCDGVVIEGNETNNATTMQDRTCYNGYIGDEPLENVAHGVLHGGVLFTTGDGSYGGLYSVDDSRSTNYNITIPEGASVEFAHLKVFYTWHYEKTSCPQMAVSITNATGTYDLPLEKAYNDLKCTCPGAAWVFPWGNYVYDLTDYIQDGGEFTVTVTRTGGPSFCVAAPGVDLVYEDENAPLIEYWINEGADVLLGGRRYPTSSNLAWWECISNATFQASTETGEVVNATIGVVAPWGDSTPDDILFFNDVELGRGVYNGYSSPYSITIDSLTMEIGAGNAQVGINATDVTTQYLKGSANMVGQADDGDNIMACNAFLVVEYESVVQEPDLIVESVYLNPYCGKHQYFANESNDVNVTIKNIGTALAGASHTKVTGASGASVIVAVGALNPGQNETVTITDTVLRPDGEVVTAIADCNAEVSESNEANNDLVIDETVMNHGLKSKRYTGGYTGPDPMNMTTWNSYELNGNLIYSVGDSLYVSDYYTAWENYTANWTACDDMPVPDTATIVDARLYVYYTWERVDVMHNQVILEFNGVDQGSPDVHYTDRKGDIAHGTTYDLPYGAVVYDVTADFNRTSNHADFYKTIPPAAKQVSMRGMMLVVVYEDPTEPLRQIFVIEEFDNLYGANSYCTTPEEATAWALFTGPVIDLETVERADLVTIVNGAGSHDGVYNPAEGELIFNGNVWTDAWDFLPGTGTSGATETELGARDLDVTALLQATDNAVGFQSNGDWMEASNAFLVVEYGEEPIISYGDSVYFKRNVRVAWRALDEPDRRGALMFRNAKIAIELEDTIPECEKVSVWVRRVAIRPPTFEVGVSSDGSTWTTIGTETCTSRAWTRYDFTGDWDNVKYIGIRKTGGSFWRPKLMGLDAVSAEGW